MDQSRLTKVVKELFASQRLAVLSTQGEKEPYGNLVAFAVSEDLKNLFFATARKTRKFTNIMANPRVSLVMDNRSNRPSDFQDTIVVTALGRAEEMKESEKGKMLEFFLLRHLDLRAFATSPDCALIEVRVEKYIIVSHFQEVEELPAWDSMLLLGPFSKAFSGTIRSYCSLPLKSTKTDLISVNSLILVVPSSEVPFPGFLRPSNGGAPPSRTAGKSSSMRRNS